MKYCIDTMAARCVHPHAIQRTCTILALSFLALAGCGGSSDAPVAPPVVVVPPVVAPRVWSAPQVAQSPFLDSIEIPATVSAHVDNCGGIVVFGSGDAGWTAQRYSPATGWQAPSVVIPKTALDVQVVTAGGVPHVFSRDAVTWRQGSLDCATNRWSLADAFPVEFSYSAALVPTALYVHFSATFDERILAASASGDGSAVVFRDRAGASTQAELWSPREGLRVRRNLLSGPPYEIVLRTLAVRTRDADFAVVLKQGDVGSTGTNGYVVASRARGTPGGDLVTVPANYCGGRTCPTFLAPRIEADGSVSIKRNIALPPGYDWQAVTPTMLRPIVEFPGLTSPRLAVGDIAIRADGRPLWIAAEETFSPTYALGVAKIFEGGKAAAWSTRYPEEQLGDLASSRMFASPDANQVVTTANVLVGAASTPTIMLSDRVDAAQWTSSHSVDVSAATQNIAGFAQFSSLTPLAFRSTPTRSFVVVLAQGTSSNTRSVTPIVIWK